MTSNLSSLTTTALEIPRLKHSRQYRARWRRVPLGLSASTLTGLRQQAAGTAGRRVALLATRESQSNACEQSLRLYGHMEESSTYQLMANSEDRDLEANTASEHTFSPSFVAHASNEQRGPSSPLSLTTGTGYAIYTSKIVPIILRAQSEVIIVTCFWAASPTRNALRSALLELSAKAVRSASIIRVQICFSSSSLARNMLLPTPKEGQRYGPEKYQKLGLPDKGDMPGLDLTVTRKFFWPFGIIHSKYVIIDRKLAVLPSCNVSWERWFEAAVSMEGPVVEHLLKFHASFWLNGQSLPPLPHHVEEADSEVQAPDVNHAPPLPSQVSTTLLPSPHTWSLLPPHLHPKRLLSRLSCLPSLEPTHPPTPLLSTTAHLLATATQSILLITPNVTAPTVLALLRSALKRGVAVMIWTNEALMTAEQLVTAGSTTPRCLSQLPRAAAGSAGRLQVYYFDAAASPGGMGAQEVEAGRRDQEKTAIKLHAKVTIVDDERILLGSGNMDAASWGTSQELGVLLEDREVVAAFKKQWPFGSLGG